MVSDEQLERSMNFIRDNAAGYAKAKATRVQLMEFRKTKKAILMRNAEIAGFKTIAAQEREAYADDEYAILLDGIKDATEQEELLRYQMKAAEMKVDIWRTISANERNEKMRYGA